MSLEDVSPATGSQASDRPGSGAPPRALWRTGAVAGASGLRLLLAPVVTGLCLAGLDSAAAAVFLVAALIDYLDGNLARRWGVATAVGSFLDTTADKVLVTAALLGLVAVGRASVWAALVIVGRELIIMGLRGSAGLRGNLIVASPLGRGKTALQFAAILLALVGVSQRLGPLGIDRWVMWVAVLATVVSGADYLARYARVAVGWDGNRPSS